MPVINSHERIIHSPSDEVGKLVDGLSSKDDKLWPRDKWVSMKFDRPLSVGAVGGHGPIRYLVSEYIPSKSVTFTFTNPKGFIGTHRFDVEPVDATTCRLKHSVEMEVKGMGAVLWPIAIRPMHDALLEDLLDNAENFFGKELPRRKWSMWVRIVRRVSGKRKHRKSRQK